MPENPLAAPEPWNLVAGAYVGDTLPIFERFARTALDLAAAPPGGRIVDVACGPGTLALVAARRAAEVAALDFAPAMIAELEGRARAAGLANVRARVGDGMALPYGDAEFDAGFSMFGLMFFPRRDAGFAELRRVVRPGGAVVVSSWQPRSRAPALHALFRSLAEVLPGLPRGEEPGPLGDPDDFRRELAAAGLVDVSVEPATEAAEVGSSDEFFDVAARSMPPVVLVARRLGDAWSEVAARLRALLRERLGAGPVRVEMPAWLGRGRVP